MTNDVYDRALARLDEIEYIERERWALEKLEEGALPAFNLLRALLVERPLRVIIAGCAQHNNPSGHDDCFYCKRKVAKANADAAIARFAGVVTSRCGGVNHEISSTL